MIHDLHILRPQCQGHVPLSLVILIRFDNPGFRTETALFISRIPYDCSLAFTMNYPDPKEICRTPDVGSKRKKTVCFASKPLVCGDDTLMGGMLSESERYQGWWQQNEYEDTKASARTMCRKMRRTGSLSDGCLSDAYDRACSIAASGFDLEAVQAEKALTPNEVRDRLNS